MLRRSFHILRSSEWLHCFYKFNNNPNTRVLYSTYDKDFPNPSFPVPSSKLYSHDTDILLEQIRKTKSLERLLELTAMHLEVMNAKHVVETMYIIHDLSKQPNFDGEALMENDTFQGICSRLMKTVRLFDPQEVITTYKALSSVGIRNNTYVMQSTLKMIGSHLNNMSLSQLTFLHFLLSRQKPNSLVDGLKLALPLVLQVQIEQQLDSDNITEIIDCLQLACRSRLKPAIIEKVLAAIIQKAKVLTPGNALTIAFALLNLDTPVDGYKELLNYCFDVLSKNVSSLNQKQTLSILRRCRNQSHYNSRFFFAVAEKIISEKWNLEQCYETILLFRNLKFAPQYFLDYFVGVMCTESDDLKNKFFYSPLNCVEYLTITGYRPSKIDDALEILCSCDSKISRMSETSTNLFIKFVSCLSILGCFPQQYLKQILHEDFLFKSWSDSKKQGRSFDYETNISCLVWSLQVYDQKDHFEFPPNVLKKLVSTLCQRHVECQSPLESFIQHGLGGSQFLLNGLFTKDGIFIDHILAMRSGNYPVSLTSSESKSHNEIQNTVKYVEDLILPEDAKIVAIVVAQEDKYCRDPEVLKGWMDLKVRCLIAKKYYPVVINCRNFLDMSDREKIPFLMHVIKQAAEDDSFSKINFLS